MVLRFMSPKLNNIVEIRWGFKENFTDNSEVTYYIDIKTI